jgi:hypothetical protein
MIYIDQNGKINLSLLHDSQKQFIKSKYLHTGIVGGYQSGKSTVATIKAVLHLLQYPGIPVAYYLPTFRLFDDMLLPKLEDILTDRLNIPFKHNQQKAKIITPYGEIWMRSMDTPDSIVSYSVGYSIVDEVDLVHPNKRQKAMQRISSRNSYKKETPNQIDFVSTPEGFAYMYNFFVKTKNENKLLLNLKTQDNAENLADGYIQGLREQYTKEQLEAYLNGQFVNLTSGTVYYNFDRILNHSNRTANASDTLHVGIDFNIGNMSAVVHVIDSNPVAVDEITKAHDTKQLCNLLQMKFPNNRIICYPDASGQNRSTNADTTDLKIIEGFGFKVSANRKNPLVMDRVKNVNRMFCNANDERKYFVNTHKCSEYTEALEKLSFDSNGIPDKNSGFDHLCDAGGYFISFMYPSKQEFKAFW